MIQNRLSVLMAERGLKIADLYEETGISKTTLMAVAENTGKGVQYETVDKLCNFLGVTPCEFFEYSPYMLDISLVENTSKLKKFEDIEVIVKKQNYEKPFYLNVFAYLGKSFDIPVKADGYKLYISIDVQSSDHYSETDFYSFLSELTLSFKIEFIDRLSEIVKKEAKSFISDNSRIYTINHEAVTLSKKDKIIIHLFENTEFETLKKILL